MQPPTPSRLTSSILRLRIRTTCATFHSSSSSSSYVLSRPRSRPAVPAPANSNSKSRLQWQRHAQWHGQWQSQRRYKSDDIDNSVRGPGSASRAEGEGEGKGKEGEAKEGNYRAWSFEEIQSLSKSPRKGLLIIDVREPSELATTGRIPSALSMPIVSNPTAIHLPPLEFRARFGFDKPGRGRASSLSPSSSSPSSSSSNPSTPTPIPQDGAGGEGESVQEVVFYCLAGVRSKRAAEMAAGRDGWAGIRIGDWGGGWSEWVERKGEVQRDR